MRAFSFATGCAAAVIVSHLIGWLEPPRVTHHRVRRVAPVVRPMAVPVVRKSETLEPEAVLDLSPAELEAQRKEVAPVPPRSKRAIEAEKALRALREAKLRATAQKKAASRAQPAQVPVPTEVAELREELQRIRTLDDSTAARVALTTQIQQKANRVADTAKRTSIQRCAAKVLMNADPSRAPETLSGCIDKLDEALKAER